MKLKLSDTAAAYPKLLKIYKELNRQNGIIGTKQAGRRKAMEKMQGGRKKKTYINEICFSTHLKAILQSV